MIRPYVYVSFLLLTAWMITPVSAQLSFEAELFEVDGQPIRSAVATAAFDLNRDMRDDLVVFDGPGDVRIRYQVGAGRLRFADVQIVESDYGLPWSITAADYDGDGVVDMAIGDASRLRYWTGDGQIPSFQDREQQIFGFLTQAANFVDMDMDGDLDYFACNDLGQNFLGLNNGQGQFTDAPFLMDFRAAGSSESADGNYGSSWCDYDRDGDQDLYISRCIAVANAPDTMLANQFFRNNGDATFTRIFEHPELLSPHQSWAADFLDVDNDGDWDLYVAHHDRPSQLFIQQDDGTFTDESVARGVDVMGGIIQIVSADYNSDGYIDLFLTGVDIQHMMINDGTGHFMDRTAQLPSQTGVHTAVNGDFNHDGRMDLHVAYATGYNDIGTRTNEIWYNTSADQHWLYLTLRDEAPNTDAIGATIELHSAHGIQLRELRAGESYGISRSTNKHFGLGTSTRIDSLYVVWPGGERQRFEGLVADRRYVLHRDGTVQDRTDEQGIVGESFIQCVGGTPVELSIAPSTGLWSTGDFGEGISVTEPGFYGVTTIVDGKQTNTTYYLEDAANVTLTLDAPDDLCQMTSTPLTADDPFIIWSTGDTTQTIQAPVNTSVSYRHRGNCALESPEVFISSQNPVTPIVESDTVAAGETAVLGSSSTNSLWYAEENGAVIHVGNSLTIDDLQADSSLFIRTYDPRGAEVGGLDPVPAVEGYHITQVAAEVSFDAHQDILLRSIDVTTRLEGARRIQIVDELDFIWFDDIMDLQVGPQTLDIHTFLAGDLSYTIRTDTALNQDELGFHSPDFTRVLNASASPGELMSITGSSLDPNNYYYYYRWNIEQASGECLSEAQEVHAIVDASSSSHEWDPTQREVTLRAIGLQGRVALRSAGSAQGRLMVCTMDGRVLSAQRTTQGESRFEWTLPQGVYIVHFIDEMGYTVSCKMPVMH